MQAQTISSKCIKRIKPNPGARLRLFCFPYAGGSASVFSRWPEYLPDNVEVCSAQLPGREHELQESAPIHTDSPLSLLAEAFIPYLESPFAFFGHSMGAGVCFELARKLRREYGLEPVHLFASALQAPQIQRPRYLSSGAPNEAFLQMIREVNGTPKEILENSEMMSLVLPILRKDFAFLENYTYEQEPPFTCPITAFGGVDDPQVDRKSLESWGDQTTGKFSLCLLDGDHFFINTSRSQLLHMVSRELRRYVRALRA